MRCLRVDTTHLIETEAVFRAFKSSITPLNFRSLGILGPHSCFKYDFTTPLSRVGLVSCD
ncbi:hypothetical protein DFQ01_11210 [Paenibacillus cellulosilyticus]|uniref:Uncharacterized protein n=1 Tax=Paenibacillus cellulosilyticus TaxID=375489 RepID=A0A2V2YRI1_9BACL|nr:hypothetical protein DFQ01_11210 [Paenibacillus cellulosilyticus]